MKLRLLPFGMQMSGRTMASELYRYGFNGKENDNEVKGEGNSLNFEARVNDPRLGRWLSMDPLFREFPHQSPYASMSNDPVNRIDPTGMGDYYSKDGRHLGSDGRTVTIGKGKNARKVSDDKAYVSSQALIDKYTKDGTTDWDKVIANSTTLSVSNSTLNKYANTVAGESSGDKLESYAIASTIKNISNYKRKDILTTLQTEGIYGFGDGGNNPAYKNNAEYSMEAAINALTGGFDHSYGAIRWDGVDLAEYGFNQYKGKYAGFEISIAHFTAFKNAWPSSMVAQTRGRAAEFSSNFSAGMHLATAGAYKGMCLYKSLVVHGRTMFWGMNRDPIMIKTTGYIQQVMKPSVSNFLKYGNDVMYGKPVNIPVQVEVHPNKGFSGSW